MALKQSTVKVPLGMRRSWFFPIKAETDGAAPTYDAMLDMGAAVKGYLTITTVSGSISGDDVTQMEVEKFLSAQLDAETTMSDLEINAKIYGHAYTEEDGETSSVDDVSINGGYGFIEPIMLKDKTVIYRSTFLRKVCAMPQSEKQEADTKKSGELAFKNNAVSYKVMEDATGVWRMRKDCATQAEAEQYIKTQAGAA